MFSTEQIVKTLREQFGEYINSTQVNQYCRQNDITYVTVTKKIEKYKTGRGSWNLTIEDTKNQLEETYNAPAAMTELENLVPEKDPNFVPFGNFTDVKKIVKSALFYPVFITGLSGNGKTQMVEQACAQLGREFIRVNITIEVDTDDLLGGFRLVNGQTVWHDGPVVEAMKRGAVLLLDEVDLASNKIMCLQSVMEGKGAFLKKVNRYVKPAPGFNIFATANTKGKGSDSGQFIGTNVLNEAFLDRFPCTMEQNYPTAATEKKILLNYMKSLECVDEDFANKLVAFGEVVRKTYNDGGCDEVISTRRLITIVQAYHIFNDRAKAVEMCVARFDDDTRDSFKDLYSKIDADVNQGQSEEQDG
jgi:MoxR-like ATPase